jgi:hypothetical protein
MDILQRMPVAREVEESAVLCKEAAAAALL